MKREYQKILMNSVKLVGSIPMVNMTGATATASAYISAYRDYSEACRLLGIIATNIEAIENTEKIICKYKNKDDYDTDELQGSVQWYAEGINKAYKELNEFISERKETNWS